MIFDKNFMSFFFLRITWWLAMFYEVHLRITSLVINMKLSFFSPTTMPFSVWKARTDVFSPFKTCHYRFFFDIFLIIRKSSVNILEAKKKTTKIHFSHLVSHWCPIFPFSSAMRQWYNLFFFFSYVQVTSLTESNVNRHENSQHLEWCQCDGNLDYFVYFYFILF